MTCCLAHLLSWNNICVFAYTQTHWMFLIFKYTCTNKISQFAKTVCQCHPWSGCWWSLAFEENCVFVSARTPCCVLTRLQAGVPSATQELDPSKHNTGDSQTIHSAIFTDHTRTVCFCLEIIRAGWRHMPKDALIIRFYITKTMLVTFSRTCFLAKPTRSDWHPVRSYYKSIWSPAWWKMPTRVWYGSWGAHHCTAWHHWWCNKA